MSNEGQEQRRAHFRLVYPEPERPVLVADTGDYAVLEIAERGVKVIVDHAETLSLGDPFTGTISFHDHHRENIEGEVLRIEEERAVIHLHKGLTMRRVMVEQARIQSKYPMFLAEQKNKNRIPRRD